MTHSTCRTPEIKADTYWPIHRAAPGFAELEGSTEMLETGIKSIDLLTPTSRAVRLVCSVVQAVRPLIQEMITRAARNFGGTSVFTGVGERTQRVTTCGSKWKKQAF